MAMPSRVSPCSTTCVRGVGDGPGVGWTSSSRAASVADATGASDRSVAVGVATACTGAEAQAVASRARDKGRLLTRLLRADSSVVDYWIWLSSVVESRREKVYCLESALKLDPTNRGVLRGL